jgi:hypothetical protein
MTRKKKVKSKDKESNNRGIKRPAAEIVVRRNEALKLRLEGKTYLEIGEILGVSNKTAWFDVDAALNENLKVERINLRNIRDLEVRRLDKLLQSIWRSATEGAIVLNAEKQPIKLSDGTYLKKIDLGAVDRVLKISERRAKLLGLDAPKKHQLGGDPDRSFFFGAEERTLSILKRFLPKDNRTLKKK